MTDLSVIEQKKLMLKARVARKGAGRPLTIKSDLAEIETQTLKRRKVTDSKATSSMNEPQTSAQFVQEEVHQCSSKKLKNLMSDDICRTDLEITSLMKETREGHTSVEFKFWSNSFNGPRFFYDYLNTTEDVNKVKTIGRKKMTQNPNSYPMRCLILARGLLESRDDYEKAESKLKDEITQLKDAQKTQSEKLSGLEKNLAEEKKRRETLESEGKASPSQLIEKLNLEKSLNDDLKETLKKSHVDLLSAGDEAFDKGKDQVLYVHPDLDLSEVNFFKVVQDGHLVDLEEVENNHSPKSNLDDPLG